ncbi:MAG TPA: hypothetical protein VKB55_09100 [Nocardioidaceae bacterium]|nr:hypothetical protein [Nocardioidaceae bacterium]
MLSDGWAALTARVLGALFLLAVGIIHLHEYQKLYSNIPTISTLFILSFVGAVVVCALLLLPVDLLPRPWGNLAVIGLALAGIGQAVIQFVFLWISEQRPLFGFQEPGYDPPAIRAARVTEVATVVFLTAFLILREIHRRNQARAADQPRPYTPTTTAVHR